MILYKVGGVYSDTASLLLNGFPAGNTIALEYCDHESLTYCFGIRKSKNPIRLFLQPSFCTYIYFDCNEYVATIPQLQSFKQLKKTPTTKFYTPIGLLALEKRHPLMAASLSQFDTNYDGAIWPCGTLIAHYYYTYNTYILL